MKTDRTVEKMRIRAKLCDQDRDFLDAVKEVFPNAKLTGLRFSDGETIGNMKESERE